MNQMDTVKRILELLYDRGEGFFTMEELASASDIDRADLDRALDLLRHRGHALEVVPYRGVRLAAPVRLDAHLIERELGTQRVGRCVICFDQVDSTNDVAFDSARSEGADGLGVLAESQRRGRGRMGRRWTSPRRTNLLLSVLLIDPEGELAQEALTVAAGLAIAEGIELPGVPEGRLKWPNDVLLDGRKVAGVLVEIRTVAEKRTVVVGIGINANASPPDEEVDLPATSLGREMGHPVERTELARRVLRRLDEWVDRVARGRMEELRTEWMSRCGMLNRRITVLSGEERYVGRALDISPLEGLILECDDGQRVHLPAAGSTVVGWGD